MFSNRQRLVWLLTNLWFDALLTTDIELEDNEVILMEGVTLQDAMAALEVLANLV